MKEERVNGGVMIAVFDYMKEERDKQFNYFLKILFDFYFGMNVWMGSAFRCCTKLILDQSHGRHISVIIA